MLDADPPPWPGQVGGAGCKLSLLGCCEGLRAKHGPLTWDQDGEAQGWLRKVTDHPAVPG